MKEIYFAGGCFWGVEEYFSRIDGVLQTSVVYANGKTETVNYKEICTGLTGYAETVYIKYDENKLNLEFLLEKFFNIIDPTSLNKQGNDRGTQYRTGIYYLNDSDKEISKKFIDEKQKFFDKKIVVEIEPLKKYILAEEYHQKYLKKNPNGYCHINLNN